MFSQKPHVQSEMFFGVSFEQTQIENWGTLVNPNVSAFWTEYCYVSGEIVKFIGTNDVFLMTTAEPETCACLFVLLCLAAELAGDGTILAATFRVYQKSQWSGLWIRNFQAPMYFEWVQFQTAQNSGKTQKNVFFNLDTAEKTWTKRKNEQAHLIRMKCELQQNQFHAVWGFLLLLVSPTLLTVLTSLSKMMFGSALHKAESPTFKEYRWVLLDLNKQD